MFEGWQSAAMDDFPPSSTSVAKLVYLPSQIFALLLVGNVSDMVPNKWYNINIHLTVITPTFMDIH
jgi:hypothetical protein